MAGVFTTRPCQVCSRRWWPWRLGVFSFSFGLTLWTFLNRSFDFRLQVCNSFTKALILSSESLLIEFHLYHGYRKFSNGCVAWIYFAWKYCKIFIIFDSFYVGLIVQTKLLNDFLNFLFSKSRNDFNRQSKLYKILSKFAVSSNTTTANYQLSKCYCNSVDTFRLLIWINAQVVQDLYSRFITHYPVSTHQNQIWKEPTIRIFTRWW